MSLLLGLLKSARFWVLSAAVIAASGVLWKIWNDRYDQGYDAAELKWRVAQQAAIDKAVAEARRLDAIAYEEAMANLETEVRIVERVRTVEKEVPKIVERVVRPECRDLGPDIQRVFNDAITAAAGLPVPVDTAVTDGEVPGADTG